MYLKDPLFLFCFASYFVNRWLVKPVVEGGFLHSYFNDLICIPFFVPIMLFAMRQCGLRKDDSPPHAHEVMIPLIVWSALFEVILPGQEPWGVGMVADPMDVFCYGLGACIAAGFWNVWYRQAKLNSTSER